MTKKVFIDEVRAKLKGLSEDEISKALEFYEEAIDDRMEEGLTEDQAVAAVGTPEEVADQILMDMPLGKLVKAKSKPDRKYKVWEIVLIILGFPIWFPLLLTAAILSTLSLVSFGFLLLAAASAIYIRRSGQSENSIRRRAAVSALISCAAVLAVLVFKKMQLASGTVRFNDFAVGFNAWLAHPFFGGGFDSLEYLQQFMPEWRSFDIGFSNSPMEILGQGGMYLAAPYVYAFAASFTNSLRNKDRNMCIAAVLFAYIFTFTVIPYQYITFFILILMTRRTAGQA